MSAGRVWGALLLVCSTVSACAVTPWPLLPMPREYRQAATVEMRHGVRLSCSPCTAEDRFALDDLQTWAGVLGLGTGSPAGVEIVLLRVGDARAMRVMAGAGLEWDAKAMDREGYVLVPSRTGLTVIAASGAGMFYGLQTVKQLMDTTVQPALLHVATVRDWPALGVRGLSDDLSRGPVPTLDFMKKEVRTLASFKINLYSPYFEHTLEYRTAALLAPPDGALTQAEARELVEYAEKFHVVIAPEQEAFGHLHNVLKWEMYAPLGETAHGQVLAPADPRSLALSLQMLKEMAGIFPGPYLHLGGDETQELGKGRSHDDVVARGLGKVYLAYMQSLVEGLAPLGRKLLFWGDIAVHDPQLLSALPASFKRNTIAVVWEYDPKPGGYEKSIKPFVDAGMECWVAPGVNNWSRVWPNFGMGLEDIRQLTAEGQERGCTGQMNTVWNDDGEGLFNSNWYGIVFGAAAGWQPGSASIEGFERSFGLLFHGDASGKVDEAQKELMAGHKLLQDKFKRSDASDLLFWVDPWAADGQRFARDLRPVLSEVRMHAERALVAAREARRGTALRETDALDAMELGARRMDLMAFKFQVSDEIAEIYAKAEAEARSIDTGERARVGETLESLNSTNGKLQDLRDGYAETGELYEQAWLKSYRRYWIRNNIDRYDMTVEMWLRRIDEMRKAQRQWLNEKTLPTATAMGIPEPAPMRQP